MMFKKTIISLAVILFVVMMVVSIITIDQYLAIRWEAERVLAECNEKAEQIAQSLQDCNYDLYMESLIPKAIPPEELEEMPLDLSWEEEDYYVDYEEVYEEPKTKEELVEENCLEWVGFHDYKECKRYAGQPVNY